MSSSTSKKHILVVDDFGSIQQFLCKTLEKKGYNTIGASNGNEAFQLLMEDVDAICLVLSDYHMPDGSGTELLRKIKDNPETAHIPVIFLTSETNPDKMKEAADSGLSCWIKKPYQADFFFAQIENALATNGR